jgi:hypothetical protein
MLGEVLLVFLVMILVAFLIETLVEAVLGTPFEKIPKLKPFKWTLMYIAIAVGIYAAIWYQFDLVFMLATFLGATSIKISIFGMVVTGCGIGKGSNYLHDIFKKYFVKPTIENTTASG